MTDLEFDQQIWRKHDRVMIQLRPDEAPFEQRVCSVSFWTRSVQVKMPIGGKDWIPFGCIIGHTTTGSSTEDCEIIENLHDKLMEAEKKLEEYEKTDSQRDIQIITNRLNDIKQIVAMMNERIDIKKRRQESIDKALVRMDEFFNQMDKYLNLK